MNEESRRRGAFWTDTSNMRLWTASSSTGAFADALFLRGLDIVGRPWAVALEAPIDKRSPFGSRPRHLAAYRGSRFESELPRCRVSARQGGADRPRRPCRTSGSPVRTPRARKLVVVGVIGGSPGPSNVRAALRLTLSRTVLLSPARERESWP